MNSLEENGHALLIRDLPVLWRRFSFRRYRIDLLGFLAAWLIVAAFAGFYWWLSGWGKR
jgi:hypothetical protein